ncbi:hypothetical protein Tco_0010298 [Tanacetum coccineum]
MAVRVPHAMSSGLSASMAKVAAMSESTLLEDSDEDDDEEDEEIKKSLDFDSVSEDTENEGLTAKDEDPAAGDEGLAAGVEGPGMDEESYGMDDEIHGLGDEGHSVESDGLGLEEEEEAVLGVQQHAALVVGTAVSAPLGLGYVALRLEDSLEEDSITVRLRFGTGVLICTRVERPERVSHLYSPHSTWTDRRRQGLGRLTDAQRATLCFAISDMQGENQDLRLQLTEERFFERFWNGLPRMGRAEMVDQARFAWGFLSVFGNANSDRVAITSRTGSYPDTRLRQYELTVRKYRTGLWKDLVFRGIVYAFGISLSCGYTSNARDEMLLEDADLEHGLEHAISANPEESSILILLLFLNFHFLNCTIGTLYKPSGG